MDKELITSSHSISITERKSINIKKKKKIDSFDNHEFLMDTVMGYIIIKGEELEIVKLDTFQGNITIKGKINSLIYTENNNKKSKEENILSKLFK